MISGSAFASKKSLKKKNQKPKDRKNLMLKKKNSKKHKSQMFNRILAYVTSHIQDCVLKEKFNKRMLRINDVKTVGQAINLLNQISQIDSGNKTDD